MCGIIGIHLFLIHFPFISFIMYNFALSLWQFSVSFVTISWKTKTLHTKNRRKNFQQHFVIYLNTEFGYELWDGSFTVYSYVKWNACKRWIREWKNTKEEFNLDYEVHTGIYLINCGKFYDRGVQWKRKMFHYLVA